MKASCRRCDSTWTGLKLEHCVSCCQTFSSTRAGDAHRTGDHAKVTGPDRRRCLTVDEMVAKGLSQNANGVWGRGQKPPESLPHGKSEAVPATP